ncbi:TRAP transporter large permease subunit [Hyphomicrobium sp. CS1BSMeth3]|uniref:TRAP transporter large permease n=1 Tax=Hyphomicrobium sp. CS1BSMeth3 TaxID=1892844 RepID=UPI00093027B6|nr:TRAP transporter large permease subunit [Hyphomicrobium sp. CS1BSMeth3]
MIALAACVLLLALLALGSPIAFALIIASAAGLYLIGGSTLVIGLIGTTTLSAGSNYELLAVPMFILMAEFIIVSRIADDLFDAATVWVGRLPGGLGVATVLGGSLFGAISGSTTAAAVTLSSTSLPAMVDRGYSPKFAGGIVVVTGTLDMLIPPSIALVFFGLVADVSIGKLLIAGVIPGIVVAMVLVGYIMTIAILRPQRVPPGQPYSFSEKIRVLKSTGPIMSLFALITGCLYTGIATPTEVSAVGAIGAMIIAVLKRRLTFSIIVTALTKATQTSCMIGFMLLGSYIFSQFFTLTRTTQALGEWILALHSSPYVILSALGLFYLVLGTFLDTIAMIILTVPIVLPVIIRLGYDPVWYGIMMIMMAQLGILTPPTGINVYIVAKYANRPVHEIFAGVFPYIFLIIGVMVIFTIWPEIVLWLPSRM